MRNRVLASLLVCCVLGCAVSSGAALTRASAGFAPADVRVGEKHTFQEISMDGCVRLSDVGAPDLPVRILRFVIPADARVESALLTHADVTELDGSYRVLPAQPPTPTGAAPEWADPDPSIYESDGMFPPQRVVYLGDGYLGGYRIASVAVYPLQYAPASGKLYLATELSIELDLGSGADRSLPRHRANGRGDEQYERMVRGLVDNPEDLPGRSLAVNARAAAADRLGDEGPLGFAPRYSPSLEGSGVEYVIITSDAFAPMFQEFADWKTRSGVPAVVRTLSWINANYRGGLDEAERMRLFIQDAYSSWGTTYVLLGGDTNIVPARYIASLYSGGEMIPSDIYFSSLEGDWNLDGDDIFGEGFGGVTSPGDSVDLYPDVFVGRAPVSDVVELETFITKCRAYVDAPDPHFTERNLFLAEVLFPYDWDGGPFSLDGATDVMEPVIDLFPAGVHNAKVYANHVDFPESHPLNSVSAIDSLNAGYNITIHVGHGNKDIIRVSKNNYVSMSDISSLSNGIARSAFLWLLDCTTAAIDFDCIAERAINNPNGGGVAAFGATRLEFPGTSREYLWEWLDALYTDSIRNAGETCAVAKAAFASPEISGNENSHRWTQLTLLLLGDPELPLWTGRARSMDVSHDASLTVGDTSVAVSVTDGAALEGALVTVMKGEEVYERALTGPDGTAVLDITPDTVGELKITVTAADHMPVYSSVPVDDAPGAHVYLKGVLVDDDLTGGSIGNGNGRVEAGECVEIGVEIGNGGVTTADAVAALLTTSDPNVILLDEDEAVGVILPGSSSTATQAFCMSVSDSCPAEHDVVFNIELVDGARTLRVDEFSVRVHRPELERLFITADDNGGGGDGDGLPEVGETVSLAVEIANAGTGDADLVSGVLSSPSGGVTVVSGLDLWGDVQSGTSAEGTAGFVFIVDLEPPGLLRLDLTDAYGRVWTSYLDLERPSAPESLWGRVRSTTIELAWTPVTDADLRGYAVYRSQSDAGPYERVTAGVIESGALFADSGLEENTLYYYYVTAVDSSGNQSDPTDVLPISTNPPAQFGWPLATSGGMYSSPAIADIDGDGQVDVIVSSEHIYAWHADGSEVIDGDGDPRTGGIFETDGSGGYRCSPAVGEVDGDMGLEIVAAAWADVGEDDASVYEVYAWNGEDGSVLPGWPVITKKFCWASPALADLDRDGRCEVVIASADGNLYAWKSDGTEFIDGDSNPATVGIFAHLGASWAYGSTAVADLDGDGYPELIQPGADGNVYAFHADATPVDGWPVSVEARSLCSPAVGDVDGDGSPEIVVGSNASKFWLLEADGTVMPGWPKSVSTGSDFPPSPVLADVAGDERLEVVIVGKAGTVTVIDHTGLVLPGWPKSLGGDTFSSPAVANIDDDPEMEIVVGSHSGKVHAFDANGQGLAGWPIQTGAEVFCSPAVHDLDGDGDNEVIVGGMDTNVYVWDTAGSFGDGDGIEWGAFLHDAWRSQCYEFVVPTGVEEGNGEQQVAPRLALEQNFPNPFNPVTSIAFTVPEGTEGTADVTLRIYSVDGSLVRTLVDGPAERGRNIVVWDGTDGDGRRVASGVYFYRLTHRAGAESRSMVLMK